MEYFVRKDGNDPFVIDNADAAPAMYGHLNAIVDELNKGGGINLKVSLSADQIKTANSAPILIDLPASGVGYYYRVTAFDCKLNFGTEAFESINLTIGSTTQIMGQSYFQFLNIILQCALEINGLLTGNMPTSSENQSFVVEGTLNIAENDTISISASSDSAVGDSTIDCYITVVKVAL